MSKFFQNYPLTGYKFGDESTPVVFQNISTYIDLVDQLRDVTYSYVKVFINDGERADNLSYRLYGTVDFYWTFYFLNQDIRESGWPLSRLDLLTKAQEDYPNWIVTTQGDISSTFLEGDSVVDANGATGTVIKRYLDLGQLVISGEDNFAVGGLLRVTNKVNVTPITITGNVRQYNGVHHYENTNGDWVDIDPFNPQTGGLIPITYYDRIVAKNESLREIDTFKPSVVSQIQSEYNKLLLRGSNV